MAQQVQPSTHAPPMKGSVALPECRILVVDNERDTADMQAMLLEMLGQKVQRAYDGRTAVALARRFRPDLVLLDLDMPGMDGVDVARELRASGMFARTRIIAHTGSVSEYTAALRMAGFDGFLTKPAGIAALVALLRERPQFEGGAT